MRDRIRKIINIFLILVTAVSVVTSPVLLQACTVYAASPQSSFEYKKYESNQEYLDTLRKKMKGVYDTFGDKVDEERTIPIPGVLSTTTRVGSDINTAGSYVPQGLCRAGKYMLVTAYDVKKKLNSVIYAVDTDENRLVSTLTLPNKYHVGGIAFDGRNIWMTGDTSDKYKGSPFVQYMTFETFQGLIERPLREVKASDISDPVYIKNRPSFLECDKGVLWVGTYIGSKGTSEGYMNGYPIIENADGVRLNTIMYRVISGIDSSAQGADIDGKYLYVSSSYKGMLQGIQTSFVTKYNLAAADTGSDSIYVKNREVKRIEVPKMNEEILVEGGNIHINFESAADYWKFAVVKTDRILAVKKSVWGR